MILRHDVEIPLLKSEIRFFFKDTNFHLQGLVGNELATAWQWEGLKEDGKKFKSSFMFKVSFPYMLILHDNWILICKQTPSGSVFLLWCFLLVLHLNLPSTAFQL
jgi:hypothetical protein